MIGSAEDDDPVALVRELLRETLRPQDQRAGRVDALEPAVFDLLPDLRRNAVRADDDDAVGRVSRFLDHLHASRGETLADLRVVDHLTEVVDGLTGLGGRLSELDRLLDAEAEPILAGEQHFH